MNGDTADIINAEFPPKIIESLFTPYRYHIYPGGRGGGRSWSVARCLLIRGAEKPLRILCAREFQSSIQDSVHKLLADQISNLRLDNFYKVEKATISGINGTEIRFAGIRTNINAIKSFEGVDICWTEEAEAITAASWDVLIPTIRKENSEFYITFNPQLETDETYLRFVKNTPPNSTVITLNYFDNPFFPDVLKEEMEYLKKIDHERYLNIWEGKPRNFLEGSIFATQIKQTYEEGRITEVRYDPTKVVHTFFDLGMDTTAIWFAQLVNGRRNIINYYENIGEPISFYLEMLQDIAHQYHYRWGKHHIPHDGSRGWIGSPYTIKQIMEQSLGDSNVIQLPRLGREEGIDAARMIFPTCWFDEEKTKVGLQCLRAYRYEPNSLKPKHDLASHGADAFRYLAMGLKDFTDIPLNTELLTKKPMFNIHSPHGWMK